MLSNICFPNVITNHVIVTINKNVLYNIVSHSIAQQPFINKEKTNANLAQHKFGCWFLVFYE